MSSLYRWVRLKFNTRSLVALEDIMYESGLNGVDSINRAVQLYALLLKLPRGVPHTVNLDPAGAKKIEVERLK